MSAIICLLFLLYFRTSKNKFAPPDLEAGYCSLQRAEPRPGQFLCKCSLQRQDDGPAGVQDQMQQDRILAVVYSTGKVIWIPPMRAVADCNTKEVLGDGQRPHTCKASKSTLQQKQEFYIWSNCF